MLFRSGHSDRLGDGGDRIGFSGRPPRDHCQSDPRNAAHTNLNTKHRAAAPKAIDGTNDAPALAQADVGVAMNTGTMAAKEAGNMVDLDSDPTKLIEVVEIGKQLLITRGALTTFSVANDVAKYFAILPAMFVTAFPQLDVLNIMRLSSPASAITSAVVFNALIIVALIPLALRGVSYRPSSASALLRRNLLLYGVGGLIAPFIGIKLLDLVISLIPGL